jgi:hypothetical protein
MYFFLILLLAFKGKRFLALCPTPKAEKLSLDDCPWTIIHHIHSYSPYLEAVSLNCKLMMCYITCQFTNSTLKLKVEVFWVDTV